MELDTVLALVLVFSCSCLTLLSSEDNIKVGKSITGNQKMVSTGGTFAFGFFTPGNSTFSYIGIWYNTIPELTVIWVANRQSPIPQNSTAVFTIGDDGNLVLFDENGKLIWSSNVSSTTGLASNSAVGALLDNGNLVLMHGESHILWQSFEHPTDTFMPEMKLGYNRTTSQRTLVNSWTSSEDPRPGNFSFGVDPQGRPQFYIWKQNSIYYRFDDSNEYSGGNFLGIAWYLSVVSGKDGVFLTYGYTKSLITIIVVLNPGGYLQVLAWIQYANKWKVEFQAPQVPCELYAQCGPFGSCGIRSNRCKCLTGFEPRFSTDWANGKPNGGCGRKVALGCDGGDGFLKHENMKLPDHAISFGNMNIKECETQCIRNCSCSAYAYSNSTCLVWFGDLLDLAHNYTAGRALYVRVRGSEPVTHRVSGNSARRHIVFIARIVSAISAILVLISIFVFVFKRKHLRRQGWTHGTSALIKSVSSLYSVGKSDMKLLQFSLQQTREATDDFHEENKLGEGGFGPVFKGFLVEFGDVAIKRLCRRSSQGQEEFMNELKLIAKLQHKNLVSLLGCCVEGEEKILIYEYMPNCSLDKFLFDSRLKVTLDWSTRFKIIEGIAQGMLYLHKYSRLKVIHRDLKVSNILLDEEMIPKISDFGMARIFGTDQTQANTNRVVGTYGYMSPEYVVYGQFSEKSDVFSFGVLVLEILTGERNSDFFMTEVSVSLLGWAWNKWKEGSLLELIDPSIRETCDSDKATRSIMAALLCVQEIPTDRPTMFDIVVMLSNETLPIPEPKEPAFRSSLQSQQLNDISINEMTFTLPVPR
ncbi:receptor-like serine/threonine-protein kinase SD1-7 [Nicotiana tabacum]|uniref:Receptor-like serine/threonine-protein kinase n=3 Tax=Nicotiana TaxID=4085 RepID=A0A1S3XJQ9_TOBAC|nr:PREDICTED: G-type lectin S-receptor-like serine/threonine-protein kinase At1g11330 isoform X2 [Nicotiana sylvestris]XP_016440215.1 PREDICTED: G-type lectin S-receptor-like serine/threonine-protein kinase At1g11330 [Nicotiana tabacum]